MVLYGFMDASGPAFGATMQIGDALIFEYGQWMSELSENSSNWREFGNVETTLEGYGREGKLDDVELWVFTDNSTTEGAYWEGTTTSKSLFDLVLRLRRLEVDYDVMIHVVHVSGTRMIQQGTDGLSRGDHSKRVMLGKSMLEFIPLAQGAWERYPPCQDWVRDTLRHMDEFRYLTPDEWFSEAHNFGSFVWAPAPAAMEVAVEQLTKCRHKRPSSMHLVVTPRLSTGKWRRQLTRHSDCYFVLRDVPMWPKEMHEPLMIFICLPFLSHQPRLSDRETMLENFRGGLSEPGV